MLVTIFENNGRKELYYGVQEHAWIQWLIYDVSQSAIDLIFNCDTHEIQSVIETIMKTNQLVSKYVGNSDEPLQ